MEIKETLIKIKNVSNYIAIFIILILLWIIFWNIKNYFFLITNTDIDIKIEDYNFANQQITWNNQNNINQKLEKELLILLNINYQLKLWLKRTTLYFPYIEKRLKEEWLPDDLKYVTIAESYLKNDAVSHAWAAGIWQFMPLTAKEYWLTINNHVDERLNYEKATNSAIQYFKYLNKRFKWNRYLSLAAYNMWQNWLDRVIKKQWVNNYFDLLLNQETSRYVFKILAVKYIYENQEKLWIAMIPEDFYKRSNYLETNKYEITNLQKFSDANWITLYNLINLNPWLKYKTNKLSPREDWKNWTIKIFQWMK
jgi:hypothetical protein